MSRPSSSAPLSSRRARRGWHLLRRPLLARPLVVLLLAACDPRSGQGWLAQPPSGPSEPADVMPAAEFLVAGADSSFWIRTGPDAGPTGMEVRRAPLVLSRLGGRWQELYVIEEDHSFHDAVFVAQALWRRDILSEDSTVVAGDAAVPALAAEYARAHPDELPLELDEPEAEQPSIIAITELSLLDVQGGYASVEHYSDLHLPRLGERHEVRRAVVDLGTARELHLAALLGEDAAAEVARRGRAAFAVARDSARRMAGQLDAEAAAALDRFTFDARSFALTQVADRPGVVFFAIGHGDAAAGFALPLAPLAVTGGAWWDAARPELPLAEEPADGQSAAAAAPRRWRRGPLTVISRLDEHPVAPRTDRDDSPPDSDDDVPRRLTLRDPAGREWPLGSIGSPAQRLYWLDAGEVSAAERRALARAFYDAAFYDGTLRAASGEGGTGGAAARGAPLLRMAAARRSSSRAVTLLRGPRSTVRHAVRRPALRSSSPVTSR